MHPIFEGKKIMPEKQSRNSPESLHMLGIFSQQLSRLTQVSRKPKSNTLLTFGSFMLIQTEESRERTAEDGWSLEKGTQRPSEHSDTSQYYNVNNNGVRIGSAPMLEEGRGWKLPSYSRQRRSRGPGIVRPNCEILTAKVASFWKIFIL